VIDLAVAVVLCVAFGAVIDSLVTDLLTPIIAMIIGEPSFAGLTFTVNDATFFYGNFIDQVITFVTIAAAIYFLVVVPVNRVTEASRRGEATPEPTTKSCPECLSEVPILARRCAFCTSELTATL
jgi:large conductance mechanosensitive channel